MAVKIRLKRMGKRKQPTYRVVVADSRSPRDGRIIESIGRYDPRHDPSVVEIDGDRAVYWLQSGAQPTERAQKLLEISGAWATFKISRGEVYTVPTRAPKEVPAAPVEEAVSETVEAATPEPVAEPEEATPEAETTTEATGETAADEPAAESEAEQPAVDPESAPEVEAAPTTEDGGAEPDDESSDG